MYLFASWCVYAAALSFIDIVFALFVISETLFTADLLANIEETKLNSTQTQRYSNLKLTQKLNLGVVTFYDLQPGNGEGPILVTPGVHTGLFTV